MIDVRALALHIVDEVTEESAQGVYVAILADGRTWQVVIGGGHPPAVDGYSPQRVAHVLDGDTPRKGAPVDTFRFVIGEHAVVGEGQGAPVLAIVRVADHGIAELVRDLAAMTTERRQDIIWDALSRRVRLIGTHGGVYLLDARTSKPTTYPGSGGADVFTPIQLARLDSWDEVGPLTEREWRRRAHSGHGYTRIAEHDIRLWDWVRVAGIRSWWQTSEVLWIGVGVLSESGELPDREHGLLLGADWAVHRDADGQLRPLRHSPEPLAGAEPVAVYRLAGPPVSVWDEKKEGESK